MGSQLSLGETLAGLQPNLLLTAGLALRPDWAAWGFYQSRIKKTEEGDCTASLGNLCHYLTVLQGKQLLFARLMLLCFSLGLLSLVYWPCSTVKSPALFPPRSSHRQWGQLLDPPEAMSASGGTCPSLPASPHRVCAPALPSPLKYIQFVKVCLLFLGLKTSCSS